MELHREIFQSLNEYKKTGDEDRKDELLEQIKDEIKEVVEHLKQLE